MERSKNFQVPLSELGCSQDSCIGGDPSDHLPASSSPPPMYASLPQNRRAEPPSARPGPRGEVLVAATPTNSSQISSRLGVSELQSQDRFQVGSSHSQESDLFQGGQAQIADQDFEPFTQAQIRDRAYSSDDDRYDEALPTQLSSPRCAPTEPSSSYSNLPGFVGGETQVATQIMDEATQPTESVSTGCDTGRLVTYAVDSDISQPALSPRQLSSEVAPRSLLSMVNPAKRWRLAGFKPLPEGPLPADTDTHVDETVLDNLTELYAQEYSRLRNHRGGDADSNQLTQSLPNPKKLSKDDGYPKALNASDLEIVPDSEATQPALVDYSHIPNAVTHLQESSLPQKAAEREQSQEEDDVPLAHQSNRVKGKSVLSRKVPVQEMPPPFTARRPLTPTISSTKTDAGLPSNKVADFGEADIVPSSNPQQDHPKTSRPSSKGRGKASAKSRLNTPAILESRIASPQLSNLTAESSDSAFPPIRECDQDTEPAGDNFMEVDSHDALPTTNRKRKRTTSSSKARPMSRTSTRTTKSLTPATRPAKRAKSSSVLRSGIAPATRIFALWKQDGHYYPGTVHSLFEATTSRYVIHFDDKTEDVVELSKMRLCQLKRGDNVLLCETNEKARVADDSQCAPDSLINVEFGRGAAQSQFAVNIQDIRVATRTIASQWKDRMLHVDDVVPVVKPRSLKQSPTPSRLSLASLGSAKNTRGVLANTGLVVTLSPGNDNWSTDKDRLMSSIKNNGGYVIDDWGSIFNMDGNFSLDGKRWTVCGEDVVFTREELDRVFLLSDDSNRKPKFLMALALGIPCLSIDWLERTTKEVRSRLRSLKPVLTLVSTAERHRLATVLTSSWVL